MCAVCSEVSDLASLMRVVFLGCIWKNRANGMDQWHINRTFLSFPPFPPQKRIVYISYSIYIFAPTQSINQPTTQSSLNPPPHPHHHHQHPHPPSATPTSPHPTHPSPRPPAHTPASSRRYRRRCGRGCCAIYCPGHSCTGLRLGCRFPGCRRPCRRFVIWLLRRRRRRKRRRWRRRRRCLGAGRPCALLIYSLQRRRCPVRVFRRGVSGAGRRCLSLR